MNEIKENKLEKLKENYKKLNDKYSLPSFQFMNENFEIESIAEESTELLVKRVRKNVRDKIHAMTAVFETFINPTSAPMFVFNVIKGFNNGEKETIERLYKKFAELEIDAFNLEIVYSEKAEAEYIKKVCELWKNSEMDLKNLYKSMKESYGLETKKSDKSYFG
jgi:predicted small metal-binding protein